MTNGGYETTGIRKGIESLKLGPESLTGRGRAGIRKGIESLTPSSFPLCQRSFTGIRKGIERRRGRPRPA